MTEQWQLVIKRAGSSNQVIDCNEDDNIFQLIAKHTDINPDADTLSVVCCGETLDCDATIDSPTTTVVVTPKVKGG